MAHDVMSMPGGMKTATADVMEPRETKVNRVEIEAADNGGYIVQCYRKSTTRGPDVPFLEPTKTAHPDLEAALAYAREEFGGAAPEEAEPEVEPEEEEEEEEEA